MIRWGLPVLFRTSFCPDSVYQEFTVSGLIQRGHKPSKGSSRRQSKSCQCPKDTVMSDQSTFPGPQKWGSLYGKRALMWSAGMVPTQQRVKLQHAKGACRAGAAERNGLLFLRVPQGKPHFGCIPGLFPRQNVSLGSQGYVAPDFQAWPDPSLSHRFLVPELIEFLDSAFFSSFPQSQIPFLPNPTVGSHLMDFIRWLGKNHFSYWTHLKPVMCYCKLANWV